ncbi:syndecan-2-like isoform X2 [Sphaeramia orbicularis]|uniref:syndecan-2-like isoform X2 n=1 Tax=Sphaeramia orbicularis TaxID=375764 RepID=UPI00117F29F4|nr:syndecan-2-like isoform X2 [Sphaeramia orbicularis]
MRSLCVLFVVGLATGFISEKTTFSTADDLYLEGRTSGDLPIDDEDGEDDGSGSGSGDYAFGDRDQEEELIRFLNFTNTAFSRTMPPVQPFQPQPTTDSPHNPPTTVAGSQKPATTMREAETTPDVSSDDDGVKKVPRIGSTADWFTESPSSTSVSVPLSEAKTTESSIGSVTQDANEKMTKNSFVEISAEDAQNEELQKGGRSGMRPEMDSPEQVTSENLWERTEVLAAVIACGVVGFLCAVFLLLLLAYRMKKKDEGSYDLGDTKLSTTAYHKAPTKEFYA